MMSTQISRDASASQTGPSPSPARAGTATTTGIACSRVDSLATAALLRGDQLDRHFGAMYIVQEVMLQSSATWSIRGPAAAG
jgi:hypothetical protein